MVSVAKKRDAGWFADKLRGLRESVGYTQAELAEAAGVRPLTITRYETGESEPGYSVLLKLAHALGVSLSAFDQPDQEGDPNEG